MKKLFNSIIFLLAIGLTSTLSTFTSCSKASASTSIIPASYQNKVLVEVSEGSATNFYTMENDGTNYQKVSIAGIPSGEYIEPGNSSSDGVTIYFITYGTSQGIRTIRKVPLGGGVATKVKDITTPSVRFVGLY